MVIWPVSPRSTSAPARRIRSGVGRARCPNNGRTRARSRFGNFRTSTRNSLVLCPIFFLPAPSTFGGGFGSRLGAEAIVRARPGGSLREPPDWLRRSPLYVYRCIRSEERGVGKE